MFSLYPFGESAYSLMHATYTRLWRWQLECNPWVITWASVQMSRRLASPKCFSMMVSRVQIVWNNQRCRTRLYFTFPCNNLGIYSLIEYHYWFQLQCIIDFQSLVEELRYSWQGCCWCISCWEVLTPFRTSMLNPVKLAAAWFDGLAWHAMIQTGSFNFTKWTWLYTHTLTILRMVTYVHHAVAYILSYSVRHECKFEIPLWLLAICSSLV